MEYEPIATVNELRVATESYKYRTLESNEVKQKRWLEWFMKRSEKMLHDRVRMGWNYLTLDPPFQPSDSRCEELKPLGRILRKLLPGCLITFIEEEIENQYFYTIEISW